MIQTIAPTAVTLKTIFSLLILKIRLNPEISDYILVSITAKNTGQAKYPYGSIAVNLSEEKIGLLNRRLRSEADGVKIRGLMMWDAKADVY